VDGVGALPEIVPPSADGKFGASVYQFSVFPPSAVADNADEEEPRQ
jgi:hypothetical protein